MEFKKKAGYKGYNLSECLYAMRDDKNAIRRRRWKGTINEVRAHIIATKELRLGIKGLIFSLRPIFVKILPRPIYKYLHKKVR